MSIKSYLDFLNESINIPPGPGIEGSLLKNLSEDEISLFSEEPLLSNLISSLKISIVGDELYYYNDKDIIDVLSQYFTMK